MRYVKWASFALGIIIAVLAAGAVAVRILLPPEKVKVLALEKTAAALGREVRLARASAGLAGVNLEGLEISEVPDFKAGTAFKARSVGVSPAWWPLIARREVLIRRVSVSDFEAAYSPPPKPPAEAAAKVSGGRAAPKAAAPAKAAPPVLNVAELALSGGKLVYKDGQGLEAVLSEAALTASGVRLDGPVPVALSFYFSVRSGGSSHSGRLELKGSLDAARGDLAKASLSFDPFILTLDGLKARAQGRVDGFLNPEVDAVLSLPAGTRTAAPALAALPEGFSLPALAGPLKVSLTDKGVDLKTLALKGDGAALSLRASQEGARWAVPEAKLAWGGVSLEASGNAAAGAKGKTSLDFKARLAPMSLNEAARLVPGAKAYEPSGTFSADLTVRGDADAPAVAGTVSLSSAAALLSAQRFSAVNARLDLTADSAVGTLKGRINDGPFEATLDARDLKTAPRVKLDARLERLDLAALPEAKDTKKGPVEKAAEREKGAPGKTPGRAPAKPFHVSGSLAIAAVKHQNFEAVDSKLAVDVRGTGADPALLDGTVKLQVGAGRFSDLKLLTSGKPMAKALLLPVIILQRTASFIKLPFFPRFDTFTFSAIRGDYALKGGVVTIKESRLDGSTADAEIAGTADLTHDTLDMRAKVRIGGQGALKLGGTVGFKVGGTLSAPAVSLDATSIIKQPVVEKAVDEAVKQGRDLLKGLFGK